ncbi:MAG: hypothetical protein QOH72_5519 [Solirubrobacteraceae bacterium]|jgi:integrase|nr:hypothetical protein [Solirubrobacteraceae bacterium]
MHDQPNPRERRTAERTRYPGIAKIHAPGCGWQGARCTCTPRFKAEVYSAREGKKIRRNFDSLGAAKTWREDAAGAVRQGRMRAPTTTTLREAADTLIAGMRDGSVLDRSGKPYKPSTIRGYERVLRLRVLPALGHVRLSGLERRDVQRLVDRWRADGLSASTVQNSLNPLQVIGRRAIRDGDLAIDPTDNLELPSARGRRERIASREEAAALIAAVSDDDRALWATAFHAGLRRGELRALRWGDVDFEARVIRVERGWDDDEGEQDGKSRAARRTVPILDGLRPHLAAHKLRTGRSADDLVFGRTASEPFIPSTVRRHALDAWKAANHRATEAAEREGQEVEPATLLAPIALHEARHTCASTFIAAGVNAKVIQTIMGHASIVMTFDVYGHLMRDGLDDAARLANAYGAAAEGGT